MMLIDSTDFCIAFTTIRVFIRIQRKPFDRPFSTRIFIEIRFVTIDEKRESRIRIDEFSLLGTFIFNNEKEKQKYQGVKRTVSLWSYLNLPDVLRTFLNPFYEPNTNVLWPSVAAQSIVS